MHTAPCIHQSADTIKTLVGSFQLLLKLVGKPRVFLYSSKADVDQPGAIELKTKLLFAHAVVEGEKFRPP